MVLSLAVGCGQGDVGGGPTEETTGSTGTTPTTPGTGTATADTMSTGAGTDPLDADAGTTTGPTGSSSGSTGAVVDGDCSTFPAVDNFASPGPFRTVNNAEGPECTIFRPATLGEDNRVHPILLWGNGTTAVPAIYGAILSHWASHGFVVAAANTSDAGTGAEMIACLDYLETENTTAGSVYEGVLDLAHVGAAGHSQGGGGSLMAGRDPRIRATALVEPYTEQGFGGYDQASQAQQNGAMFLISGTADTTAPAVPHQQRVWDTTNVPVVWGIKMGANHVISAIGAMPGFRPEITAWLRFQLMCDPVAAEVFVGPCTMCDDATWETQRMDL